ncbi:hypothetical protein CHS0354_018112 [Potamilus streckersoni]|uniref:Uncharacterized protein n=1 Tax=Potamilus streckersoni TaxID=2493646 RepID=A0AAE0STT5_9BIVA|nr:hypothetical protein CHS0354_018112 [Potamilus streckersoni]
MQRHFMESMLELSINNEKCGRQFCPKDDTALRIEKMGYKECREFKASDLNSLSKPNKEESDFINLRNLECDSPNKLPAIITKNDIESHLTQKKKQCSTPKEQRIDKGTNSEVGEDVYFYDTENRDEDTEFGEFEKTEGVFPRELSNNAIRVPVQDEDSETFKRMSVNDLHEERNMPISPISNLAISCFIEDILKGKRRLLDSNVRAHYKVMQRRLRCGSRLETQRKELKRRENNPQLRNSMTKKYNTLLEEYLNLCRQESVILDQIAFIQAEIDVWQKKNRHKQAVVMKSVLLEPGSPQYSSLKAGTKRSNEKDQRKKGLLFPPLPPPKPLMTSMCKGKPNKSLSKRGDKVSIRERFELSNRVKPATFDNMPPTCTFYSFYPMLEPRRQHKRPTPAIRCNSEEKIKHRLQKFQGLLEPEYNIRPEREITLEL